MTPTSTETNQPSPDVEASSPRRRRTRALGVLLAGLLVLSACGGSPEGDGQSSSGGLSEPHSDSASSSDSATDDGEDNSGGEASDSSREATDGTEDDSSDDVGSGDPVPASAEGPAENWPEPQLPDKASQRTKQGAKAAVAHWWEMVEYAKLTLNPEMIAKHSTDDCAGCARQAASVIAAVKEEVWYTDVDIETGRSALAQQANDRYRGSVIVDSAAFEVFTPEGHYQTTPASDNQTWAVELIFQNGQWEMSQLELSSSAEDGDAS